MPETVSTEPNMPTKERVNPQVSEPKPSPKWFQNLPVAGRVLAALGFIANTGALVHSQFANPAEASGTPVSGYSQSGLTPDQRLAQTKIRSSVERREQEIITKYTLEKFRQHGSTLSTLITNPADSKRYIAVYNPETNKLETKGQISFNAISHAVSPTNPNIIVVVGETTRGSDSGIFTYTTDGGQNWQTKSYPNGMIWDVQIMPDNLSAIMSPTDHVDITKWAILTSLNLSTGTTTDTRLTNIVSGGSGIENITQPFENGSVTTTFVKTQDNTGYYQLNISTSGITGTRFNVDEGFGKNELIVYLDSIGKRHIWLFNTDTNDPSQSNNGVGTLYENIDNVLANRIRPKVALYNAFSSKSVNFLGGVADISTSMGYLGILVNEGANVRHPYIEIIDLNDPTNLNKRELVPNDGVFPQTGLPSAIYITSNGSDKFLNIGVWCSTDGTCDRTGKDTGLYRRKITNGINGTDIWEKLNTDILKLITPTPTPSPTGTPEPTVKPNYQIRMPIGARNSSGL